MQHLPPHPPPFQWLPPPAKPSPSGLMNGTIRHASCPGGEQAAPAGEPSHRASGGGDERRWARPACQDSHYARLGQRGLVEIWRNARRAGEAEGCRMHTQRGRGGGRGGGCEGGRSLGASNTARTHSQHVFARCSLMTFHSS